MVVTKRKETIYKIYNDGQIIEGRKKNIIEHYIKKYIQQIKIIEKMTKGIEKMNKGIEKELKKEIESIIKKYIETQNGKRSMNNNVRQLVQTYKKKTKIT